jgi:tetratricopeptide (TPR) repeat protein
MERALSARDAKAVWRELEPFRADVAQERELAEVWVTLLAGTPHKPGAREEANEVIARFADDGALVAVACAALIAIADRVPFDEPRPAGDAASDAARAAEAALGRTTDPAVRAMLLAARGNALVRLGADHDAAALAALEEAVRIEPRGEWLSDLGVLHKRARRFRAALVAFEKAREKLGDRRPLLFHVALCAVAEGDHARARAALLALGLPVEGGADGDGRPFVPDLPQTALRLPTLGTGHDTGAFVPDQAAGFERVWMQPLSPVHGVVRSPTHREAVADFGDVVLVDPAPVAWTIEDGARKPVRGLLGVLAKGDERRLRFLGLEQKEGDGASLGDTLPEGCVYYLHGVRVEQICPRCAAGETLVRHEHQAPEEHRAFFGKLVVPAPVPLRDVARALEKARSERPGVLLAIPGLFEALGDTAAAGKAHKTWGVIERGLAAATKSGKPS